MVEISLLLLWIITVLVAAHQRNVYLRTTANRITTLQAECDRLESMLQNKNHEIASLTRRIESLERRLSGEYRVRVPDSNPDNWVCPECTTEVAGSNKSCPRCTTPMPNPHYWTGHRAIVDESKQDSVADWTDPDHLDEG